MTPYGDAKIDQEESDFFGVVETLSLACHYTSFVDLSSEMKIFRDQTWPWSKHQGTRTHS